MNEYTHNTYIPYSVRNNIYNPEYAKLFDYIERVMGWDFKVVNTTSFTIIECNNGIRFAFDVTDFVVDAHSLIGPEYIPFFYRMDESIFFESYTTLLPLIRNEWKRKNNV